MKLFFFLVQHFIIMWQYCCDVSMLWSSKWKNRGIQK